MFWVPQSGRLGLGISILSYNGEVMVGVASDAGLVPDPERIVEERGLRQVTDTSAIEPIVAKLIAENPGQVESWRKNPKVAGWFTGQVMKATGGKANPGLVNEIVARQLAALG